MHAGHATRPYAGHVHAEFNSLLSGAPLEPRPQEKTVSDDSLPARLAPYVLSILRIMAALLFLEHGLSRMFGFPSPLLTPPLFSMYWFAGAIEFAGGILLTLGLFSRLSAFVMSGEMAFAYFLSHAPRNFFPALNGGDAAILYCFIFLYIAAAGPGPWSLDSRRR